MKPKVSIIVERCTGCKLCVDLCPGEVFKLVNGKAQVVNEENCVLCYGCTVFCGPKAIVIEDMDP